MEFHMEIYIKKNIHMHKSCPTLVTPWTSLPGSCLWDFPGKNTGVGCHSFSRGFSQVRDGSWSPALQVDSLPTESARKPL